MMLDEIDLSGIQEENARQLVVRLLNLIEALSADLRDAQVEIQRLRDEVNRLKGEQGKPNVKGNTPQPPRPITRRRKSDASPASARSAARRPRFGSTGNRC
jgi:hypothetical protein